MIITRKQARIAAETWLEDAGDNRNQTGKERDMCLELAAIYMVQAMWPVQNAA